MKRLVIKLVEHRARKLLKKFKPKIIAVTGSVGKTSTKLAVATVLSKKYNVLAHYGSYNTPISLPLAMFNAKVPQNVRSMVGWLKVLRDMDQQLRGSYPYDVLVLELGSDHVGEVAYFKKYLKPDIAVVTAVSPEHMEGFGTLEAVAEEELAVAHYSNLTLINRDDIDGSFAKYLPNGINIDTYGTSGTAEYRFVTSDFRPGKGFKGIFISPEFGEQKATLQVVGEHNVRSVVAAGAAGIKMGLGIKEVIAGMEAVVPVHGRMNLLRGVKRSTIIDDSYNSSPLATIAALQTLYVFPSPQRIAVLGSMNEMGNYSQKAHQDVGNACDPALLEWVVTIGEEAKQYLAPAAQKRGCRVESFLSPYDAGAFVHKIMQDRAVILVKGSQNRVFSEETVKMLLHSTEEETQLVRQTADWLAIKEEQFGKFR